MSIAPKRVAVGLSIVVAMLLVAHLIGYLVVGAAASGGSNWRLLNVDWEANIPSWFSSALLWLCAVPPWLIADATPTEPRFRKHWRGLAVLFVFLSLDELAALHEELNHPIRNLISVPQFLVKRSWVVAAVVFVVVIGAIYVPFLRSLPARTRRRFFTAGSIYVVAAVVIEVVGGAVKRRLGVDSGVYQLSAMSEEGLEMIGAILFLHAGLAHLAGPDGKVHVRVSSS